MLRRLIYSGLNRNTNPLQPAKSTFPTFVRFRTMASASYDPSARSAFLSAVQKVQSSDFAEEGSDAAQLSKAMQDLKLQEAEQDLKVCLSSLKMGELIG